MKDVGQIRALKKERFSGIWIFCKSHMCSSEDTRTFRISESYENVCTVDQLKFELCEDSVGKKAANASDNKTSVFSTPSILRRKDVVGPSGLKQVMQRDYSQLFSTPSIFSVRSRSYDTFSQLFVPLLALGIHI